MAQRATQQTQSTTPNENESPSIVIGMNIIGECKPNFYNLKGQTMRKNHIYKCVWGAHMAMQPKTWKKEQIENEKGKHKTGKLKRPRVCQGS